jgi:hypothetical protein
VLFVSFVVQTNSALTPSTKLNDSPHCLI